MKKDKENIHNDHKNIPKRNVKNTLNASNQKNNQLTSNSKNIVTSNNKKYLERSSRRKFSICYNNEPETCNSTMKRQTSQKSFRNSNQKEPKTPRPFYLEPDSMSEYQSGFSFDENREQVSKMLKEKESFETYCFKGQQ